MFQRTYAELIKIEQKSLRDYHPQQHINMRLEIQEGDLREQSISLLDLRNISA